MKAVFFLILCTLSISSLAQQQLPSILENHKKAPLMLQQASVASVLVDSSDIIWHEDFREGLAGNNSSIDPAWTTGGTDGDIWALDFDGSDGDYAGDDPYTIESESAANGWMIFDADGDNAGLAPSAYTNKKGYLTSPYIDLSNDSNVTLSFQHAYRWCCSSSHELYVFINDGSGWSNDNSFLVNDFGTTNILSGTVTVDIIISEIAALKDSVQIRFDWSNDSETASHYFWMVDDVRIVRTQAYASNILKAYNRVPSDYFGGTNYRVMPLEQMQQTAYFFGGIVENIGYNPIDSIRVKAQIESEAFTSESYGYSIPSADRDTMFVNDGFTAPDTGVYTASLFAKDDNDLIITDTLSRQFEISEFTYARDNGNNQSSFGRFAINDEGTRQYGNIFDIYKTTTVYAATVRLDEQTTPVAFGKIVLNTVDPNTGDIFFFTETELIDFGNYTGDFYDFSFTPPVILDEGLVVLPTLYAEVNATDTIYISTAGDNQINGESLVQDIDGVQEGVDPASWLYTTFAPCIRLNFDPTVVGVNVSTEEHIKTHSLAVFPNPNNGEFKVQLLTNEAFEGLLTINDMTARTVYTEAISVNQSFNKTIDLSNFEKGVYFISLTKGDQNEMFEKIIIQ
ncbi:MAG: T9SS type A sorting domain-containing protein [Flavobacteriales bacterium]